MKLTIDAELCTGHGRCWTLAAELFDSDEVGNGIVRAGVDVGPRAELAQLAVVSCPEQAITLTD